MCLLDLPPELVHTILNHVRGDKKLLYALSITCHFLHAQANPLLYSKVRILYHTDLFHFSETMLANPTLASYVKSFSGSLFRVRINDTSEPLKGWQKNIVNLKYLHLTPCPRVPFRLESLEVSYYSAHALSTDSIMHQPDFVHINNYIFGRLEASPLSPLMFPDLKVLRGTIYAARAVLPGREVVRFEWDYPNGEPEEVPADVLEDISGQLNELRSLSYRADALQPLDYFNKFPKIPFNSLRFLEIQRMHPEDWTSIPTLPRLRVLLVLESNRNPDSMLKQPDRIVELFSKCLTLRRVDVGGQFHIFRGCYRWVRGAEGPISIPLCVAEKGRMEFIDDCDSDEDV